MLHESTGLFPALNAMSDTFAAIGPAPCLPAKTSRWPASAVNTVSTVRALTTDWRAPPGAVNSSRYSSVTEAWRLPSSSVSRLPADVLSSTSSPSGRSTAWVRMPRLILLSSCRRVTPPSTTRNSVTATGRLREAWL